MIAKTLRAVMKPLYIRMFFVVVPFLAEIPLMMTYTVPLQKIGLAWAALYLIYDFFTARRTLKARYVTLIVPFLIVLGLSAVLNRQTMLQTNAINWAYTVAVLLVLYLVGGTAEEQMREMSVLNWLLCLLTLCAAAVSLWMFVTQYSSSFTYNDYAYPVGVRDGRLTGVFRNAIYPTAVLGLFAGWMQLRIDRLLDVRRRAARAAVLWVSMVLNFLYMCLTYSRGLMVGLLVSAFVVGFFDILRVGGKKEAVRRRGFVRAGCAVLAAVVCAGVAYGAVLVARESTSYIPPVYAALTAGKNPGTDNPDKPTIGEKIEGRTDPSEDYGPLTGRLEIWKQAAEYFVKKPLIGYGAYSLADSIHLPNSSEQLSHFHNLYIHSLVATGVLGSVFLFAFLLLGLWGCARYLFTKQTQPEHPLFTVMTGMLIFLLVINLLDVTILFMDKHSGYIFFIYFGYAMALIRPEKPWKGDAPARALDRRLPGGKA